MESVVTGLKSNRTNKTNNQNPFECILTKEKICLNGIGLFDFNQIEPIVQLTTNSAKLKLSFVEFVVPDTNQIEQKKKIFKIHLNVF